MKSMTDHDAFYGEFRAVTCEWIGDQNERCRQPNIFGQSYCEDHHNVVFRTTSTEAYEKEVESNIVESKKLDKELVNEK